VKSENLRDFVHFSPEMVKRTTVFETGRLWSEVVCLDRNQGIGPVKDLDSDALFTILAGQAVFQVNGRRSRLDQWGAVLVPAGEEVTVKNASIDPLVLFVVTAPPPVQRPITE
jgi:mannose-6-phosphate isomerase-like protein (cupin superfamily)